MLHLRRLPVDGEVMIRGQVMEEAGELNEKQSLSSDHRLTDSIVVKMFCNEQVPEVTEHVKKGFSVSRCDNSRPF